MTRDLTETVGFTPEKNPQVMSTLNCKCTGAGSKDIKAITAISIRVFPEYMYYNVRYVCFCVEESSTDQF